MSMENLNVKPNIRVIPARPRQSIGMNYVPELRAKERVCAYARVSTDSEEQESSYELQVSHYTKFINDHADWEFVGVYADEGISGKNLKRPQFMQMIKDCEDNKIDRIITKSVSRFARNALDCVGTIRKLKEKRIGVYFEKENLDTMKESTEFILTLMSSLAEEESRSLSNNIRWSVKKRFEQGKVIINTAHFLGYTKDEDGNLKILPEEAIIVRRIFHEFLGGASLKQIAYNLEQDGILSPSGKQIWHPSTIKSMLQNEKYKGDSLLQKTYLADFLSPRRVKNEGQAQMYYVEDSHPAIIDKETFENVQQEFINRKNLRGGGKSGKGKYACKYVFSGMITCGKCGEIYRRHQQYNRYKKYYIWTCKRHENTGAANCDAKPIKEDAIKQAFVKAVAGLVEDKANILKQLSEAIGAHVSDSNAAQVSEVDNMVATLQNDLLLKRRERQTGEITQSEYETQIKKMKQQIDDLYMQRQEIESEQAKVKLATYRKEEIRKMIETESLVTEFDDIIFKNLVKGIKVVERHKIEIEFECGLKVEETV